MQSSFTGQILADKLAKLNSTQQSIETLSHWCIFHKRSAKQVVDIWAREFFQAPRERRVPFLYLANDILQNSRRKGAEFVTEFWRVLPGALKDVVKNGDDNNRGTVFRLIDIWEERRVFGSHAQGLRNEFLGKERSANSTDGPLPEKLAAVYKAFHDKLTDEETVIDKCNNAVFNMEAFEKEIDISGQESSAIMLEELQHEEAVLLDCAQQLEATEMARSSIVFQLRETLRDQEEKLDRTRLLLQAAHSHAEQARSMQQQIYEAAASGETFQQQQNGSDHSLLEQFTGGISGIPPPTVSTALLFGGTESYVPTEAKIFDPASIAAKLVASTSSAAMISSMLSSLAAENVVTPLQKLIQPPQPQPQQQQQKKVDDEVKPEEEEEEGEETAEVKQPEAKRQKVDGDGDEVEGDGAVAVGGGEPTGGGGTVAATVAAAAAATSPAAVVAQYLDSSMLLPFNFAAGQFPLPTASSASAASAAPPGCAPVDYQQTASAAALGFFAAPQ